MDDQNEFIDLDRITNSEFREQIKTWIEERGIHESLQLQMKKDLIDQISRTALGRKMSLKLQTHQGIMLSPLVLVLNTLVAEFLYTQNCHFSLSVFSNEVPFKNTLPDFTKSGHFRLSRIELQEIFEALGIVHSSELIEKYESKPKQSGKSLLYIIFKSMLASVRSSEEKIKRLNKAETEKDATKSLLDGFGVDKLHRNVEKLLHKVKLVSKNIERFELLKDSENHGEDNRDEQTESLRICTENVQKLVGRLESCSKVFETLIEKLKEQTEQPKVAEQTEKASKPEEKVQTPGPKSYTDFLNELKNSEHGKKYVAKLQKQILKLMDKEKALLEAKYAEKIHRAELEYKSKLEDLMTERIREVSVPVEIRHSPKPTNKTSESDESALYMKKIDEKLNRLYQHEKNVDEKLVTLKNDLHQQEIRQSQYFKSLKAAETKEKKLAVLQDVERQLLATFEDETQTIVRNAKATIQQLESESDKINRSFQNYLQKQREDKRKLNNEKVQIWQKYNDEKLELNQRELLELNDHSREVPIVQEVRPTLHDGDLAYRGYFENPFKNFDPHKYLKKATTSTVHDFPKYSRAIDVGINTSFAQNRPAAQEIIVEVEKQSSVTHRKNPENIATDIGGRPQSRDVFSKLASNGTTGSDYNLIDLVPVEPSQAQSKLSELLAKDTNNLKKSIEENLQKLDQMSKTYSKGTSSSNSADKLETYTVKLTIEPPETVDKSLDESSSGPELKGLSDGELTSPQRTGQIPILDNTRELLAITKETFSDFIIDADEKSSNNVEKEKPVEIFSLGSLSDLDLSGDSGSNPNRIFTETAGDSSNDILEQISTGKRSLSEHSWS
ncbi:centriole and centriolar satellite protein OFD1 [Sabethes cyaneus]|uniref:centriole and centriolar satellite protein OFD1 n=1 Tax=Sabethes cyaneus TaxID=53552 RepID=UPI00237DB35A|nr:centriole and centriolar satellite protein OFD1 [Sabethes cyaneus]